MANQPPPPGAAPAAAWLGYLGLPALRAFLARGRAAAARRRRRRRHKAHAAARQAVSQDLGRLEEEHALQQVSGDFLSLSRGPGVRELHLYLVCRLEIETLHHMFRELVTAAPAPPHHDAHPARHEGADGTLFPRLRCLSVRLSHDWIFLERNSRYTCAWANYKPMCARERLNAELTAARVEVLIECAFNDFRLEL
ncbi:hypothetical protein EVAR_22353_1 [Eumeta japonica]|uniref:Uncharacterized protein n=1 Tax=Eumeta variegata TaxID=151549 RepID=A0A4C1VLF8_EUMVA|nr:hypothetical protein EVAR_22353_1 [Eumeta japonica]